MPLTVDEVSAKVLCERDVLAAELWPPARPRGSPSRQWLAFSKAPGPLSSQPRRSICRAGVFSCFVHFEVPHRPRVLCICIAVLCGGRGGPYVVAPHPGPTNGFRPTHVTSAFRLMGGFSCILATGLLLVVTGKRFTGKCL